MGVIRAATLSDAESIHTIYRPYVENTATSFEETVPNIVEIQERIKSITQHYPWLVYESEQELLGYAYAGSFRNRMAYRWTAEVTIYMAYKAKGEGLASQLYQALLDELAERRIHTVVAVVTEPNPESEKFHEKMGFRKIGVFESIGYKFGRWHNTGWWQKSLPEE